MMNPLKKYRQRKAKERLARKIADQNGKTVEYETARFNGLSPLKALEYWDIGTDAERNMLLDDTDNNPDKSESNFNRISTIVSVAALFFSGVASYFTYQATMKVNSKDYLIAENMKSDLTEMMSILNTIDNKALLFEYSGKTADFSCEQQSLKSIQTRPGYLIFLNLINDSDRPKVEDGLLLLTDDVLTYNAANNLIVRAYADWIQNTLSSFLNQNNLKRIDYSSVLKQSYSENRHLRKKDIDAFVTECYNTVQVYFIDRINDGELNYKEIDSIFSTCYSSFLIGKTGELFLKNWNENRWKFMRDGIEMMISEGHQLNNGYDNMISRYKESSNNTVESISRAVERKILIISLLILITIVLLIGLIMYRDRKQIIRTLREISNNK